MKSTLAHTKTNLQSIVWQVNYRQAPHLDTGCILQKSVLFYRKSNLLSIILHLKHRNAPRRCFSRTPEINLGSQYAIYRMASQMLTYTFLGYSILTLPIKLVLHKLKSTRHRNRENYLLVIRGTDVIWASNLELLELIFFLKEQAARSAAQRASIRFALLALKKKINSSSSKFEAQITSVPLITNSDNVAKLRAAPRDAAGCRSSFTPVSEVDVLAAFSRMTSNAVGDDNILLRFLKDTLPITLPIIVVIFNISTGYFCVTSQFEY
ncbi:hypothetical protein J6590_084039 [Homalodisca vitripennis]|nr:hypothetical protein J6590_084039 [Homalodisca vitripennis]